MKIVKFIFIFLFVLNNADARDCVESTDKNGQKGYFVKDGEIIYDGVRNPTVKFCGMQRRDQGNKAFIATTAPARPPVASNTQISNVSSTARADSITISGTMDPTNTKAKTVWGQLSQNGQDIGNAFPITITGNTFTAQISPGDSGYSGAPGDYDVKVWYQNVDNKKSGAFTQRVNVPGYCRNNYDTGFGKLCDITFDNAGHKGTLADPLRSSSPLQVGLKYDTSKVRNMCVAFYNKVVAKEVMTPSAQPALESKVWTIPNDVFNVPVSKLESPAKCGQLRVRPNIDNIDSCVIGAAPPNAKSNEGEIRTWVESKNLPASWDRGGELYCQK